MNIVAILNYIKYIFIFLLTMRFILDFQQIINFRISSLQILSIILFIFTFRNKFTWYFGIIFFLFATIYYFSEERLMSSWYKDYEYLTPIIEIFRIFYPLKPMKFEIVLRIIPLISYSIFIILFLNNKVRKLYNL